MKAKISLLMITKNSDDLLKESLTSAEDLVDEIVIVDSKSTDNTVNIANSFAAQVFTLDTADLGKKRAYGLDKVTSDWVLVLDADELITISLKNEIKKILSTSNSSLNSKKLPNGFLIPFRNHFLGRPVNFGGEDYKMLRLFRKDKVVIPHSFVHERFSLKKGALGILANKINHYSYRTLFQMYSKFTDYGLREAAQKKSYGEKSSLKKIIFYPIHMFWARFFKDKGYKDGIFRIPLDAGFAYMEFLTYTALYFFRFNNPKSTKSK